MLAKKVLSIAIQFAALLCVVGVSTAYAALDAKLQSRIREATFEVVVPKPETDPLTYEKPLPMELVPFSIRNDKFEAIGTAFLFGKNEFVTAAHVLRLGSKSQFPAPVLRDAAGKVYEIDKISKYSLHQDFVIFSVKQRINCTPLRANTGPKVGAQIFAVGNALGQGIVFRDGLYTSNTPEEVSGRWQWLRFSAAASPGNSGGPLLDDNGLVVGVVLRKSPNENLNFALPIAQVVAAPANVASIDTRTQAYFALSNTTERAELKKEIALPKTFAELNEELEKITDDAFNGTMDNLFANNGDALFPKGNGSVQLLHVHKTMGFPTFIIKKNDGIWDATAPDKVAHADLGHNGVLGVANYKGTFLLHIRKPDDVTHQRFYSDSKLFLDTILKGVPLNRPIATEKIRITSMGNSGSDEWYTDAYQRKWQLRTWAFGFADVSVVALAVPVPNGYVTMLTITPTSMEHQRVVEFKHMADFVYVSYQGKLSLWKEFLADPSLLPANFADMHVDIQYNEALSFESKRFGFKYANNLQSINEDSALSLQFTYFRDGANIVWDVAGASVLENYRKKNAFVLSREIEPSEGMTEEYKSQWQRMVKREHPYDAITRVENDSTSIEATISGGKPKKSSQESGRNITYSISHRVEGTGDQAVMNAALDKFRAGIELFDE